MDPQKVLLDVGGEIKAQNVRILDVFVIGPLMIMGGMALHSQRNPIMGTLLLASGAATIVFNGGNFFRIREKLAAQTNGE